MLVSVSISSIHPIFCKYYLLHKKETKTIINLLVPTIPSGNIHAPTVMVAEKGADLIKELWLQEEVVRAERAAASPKINDLANVTIAA